MFFKYFKKYVIALIILFISLSTFTYAQLDIKDMNAKIPLNPKVKTGKLKNGLTYFVMENHKPENRAELQMVVRTGSLYEDDDQQGLAHFIEHMCFNGTKHFPKNELVSFIESLGMKFGADLNANTGFERTYYLLTVPMDRPNILDSGFQVLKDWLHNVTFDPDELEKERGVILEEWRLYLSANQRIMKKHFPYIFYKSRYVDRLPIGDTAIILHAPRQRFVDFYKDWYRPNISAIIAVGDFNADEVIELIKKKFSDIPNPESPKPRIEFPIESHKETFVSIETDKEMTISTIQFYFKHPSKQEDSYKNYKQNIINNLLNGIIAKRLQELTQKADPPFIFASAAETHLISNMSTFYALAALKEDNINGGIKALLGEIFKALQHGITPTELEREKKESMRFIEKALKEKDKTESQQLALELGRHFDENESAPGIEYEYELYKKWIPEITVDDLNNVLKKAINKENLAILFSGPEKEGFTPPTKKDLLNLYSEAENTKYEPYVDKVAESPLFNKKVNKGKVISSKEFKDLGITMFKLNNGIEVYLKPTDFKNDEILFRAYSPGGTSLSDDDDYLSAQFAASIIKESGVADYDKIQLDKFLSDKIVNVSPFIGTLTEGFQGNSSPQDLEILFQLINLYFTEPRKDSEAYNSYITKIKESIKNDALEPRSVFNDTISYVMANYHKRYKPLTEEMLNKINLDKAIEFYQDRFYDASDFTFIFVGNFKIDEIKPLIEKYLGSLPKKKRNEKWQDIKLRYPKGKIQKEVKKGQEKQSSVRLVFTGDFEWNDENRFKLEALTDVLNIKLRENIREEEGGTYGVYSFGNPQQFPKPTYRIDLGFGANPDRVPDLLNKIEELIKEMQRLEVDDSYIQKVKEQFKREYEKNLKENNFWLGQVYDHLFNGITLDDILKFNEQVDKLTAEDIKFAAQYYFNWNNYAKFILYPENK